MIPDKPDNVILLVEKIKIHSAYFLLGTPIDVPLRRFVLLRNETGRGRGCGPVCWKGQCGVVVGEKGYVTPPSLRTRPNP